MHYCRPVCHSQMAALDPVRHFDLLATAPCDLLFLFRSVQSKAFQASSLMRLLPLVVVTKCGSIVIKLWGPGSPCLH